VIFTSFFFVNINVYLFIYLFINLLIYHLLPISLACDIFHFVKLLFLHSAADPSQPPLFPHYSLLHIKWPPSVLISPITISAPKHLHSSIYSILFILSSPTSTLFTSISTCLTDHSFSTPLHTTLPLPSQVKLQYRKAMLVVHPDRCSSLTTETKFIAKRIFEGSNPSLLLLSHFYVSYTTPVYTSYFCIYLSFFLLFLGINEAYQEFLKKESV
jgi:hypothetical protein